MKRQLGNLAGRRDFNVMPILAGVVVAAAALARSGDASACGACYANSSESTVVNDHKMAFSIQKQRTILWDQISYSGNPSEFAYVIPAKPGTRLEPSNEAWFTALEASTRPIIMAPQSSGGGYGDDESSSGCCSSSSMTSASSESGGGGGQRENVQVVDQSVVGPYETVTIRSTDPQALQSWLQQHGYAIPSNSGPIIASYVEAGLDFIALRLRPGLDARAMAPIRIVSPGTDTALPLRMMQIGAGAKVGITLYVIGEGRYHTASFPDVPIDFDKLIWDYGQSRSNYQELSLAAMASNDGRGFITEYADRPSFDMSAGAASSGMTSNTGLAAAYKAACPTYGTTRPPVEDSGIIDPPPVDAGIDAADDAGDDAGDSDAGDSDASVPGDKPDAGPRPGLPTWCDDLDVAVEGMPLNNVRLVRLRASLPNAALADTLRLEPATTNERLDNVHYAKTTGTIPTARVARLRASREQGTFALIALTAVVVSRLVRRKKKS